MMSLKISKGFMVILGAIVLLSSCGGGSGGSGVILYYPYRTVYGHICQTFEPIPGCTFDSATGQRITVHHDPHYDRYRGATDDMWYVIFDLNGVAAVYDELGRFRYYASVSQFAGYMGGYYIGVGSSSLYWEDIRGKSYWLGKNGVLYSANLMAPNFGRAINENDEASHSTRMALMQSAANRLLVQKATQYLHQEFDLPENKARLIASSLNAYALTAVTRGYLTTKDIDSTFETVFGVTFSQASQAVKALQKGEKDLMRSLTEKSSQYLGISPQKAQRFIKLMYKEALAQMGYNIDDINW